MRYLFSFLITIIILIVSFVAYAFVCWLFDNKPTFTNYTFVLIVNLMWQFYHEGMKDK